MTKFTIIAGAFTVGAGFGLQNIINNFVSGLILLFERPVKVGDLIEVGDTGGVVERIGIRASVLRAADGSEMIVPNGNLISNRVTNWTFSDSQRLIEVPIPVAQAADPDHVIELLKGVAAAHPLVIKDPPPQALVLNLGPGALNFELRAWTDRAEDWMQIRSELAVAIKSVLAKENISIP
jgi:small-conductance mechanosensitive channel